MLVSEVRASKHQGSQHFVLVDAGFLRPHAPGDVRCAPRHRTHPCRRHSLPTGALLPTVVAGPLCESGDVFTQGEGGVVLLRDLPKAQVGDWLVLHDTGAYGASMSSNYNTRPLIPEVLVDGTQVRLIRRKQTVAELLALELLG